MLTSSEIRSRFLEFFENKGHVVIPSASLIPENDPSVLFNTAGMQPLVPYLLGQPHPAGRRLVDIQKCVRTNDIDEVGDNTHLTFFEMMGNWSLGDYFKKEAIEWSYEFLTSKTEGLDLDPRRLYVTCFEGDENAPQDLESVSYWQQMFARDNILGQRIYFRPADKNWWSAGDNGPCGPDTEMFYDVTGTLTEGMTLEEYLKADDEQKVVEIWNDVFMEYLKKDGKVIGKLDEKNVDTGSGLERVTMMLQGKNNVFETDLFEPLINEILKYDPNADLIIENKFESFLYEKHLKSIRIIADHIRTSVFMIADGVVPSSNDRGYILRRLIRRAVFQYVDNNLQLMLHHLVLVVAEKYKEVYPDIFDKRKEIERVINDEEIKFLKTLVEGKKELSKMAMGLWEKSINGQVLETAGLKINGKNLFYIYSTYGFPFELSIEEINRIKAHLKSDYRTELLSNEEIKKLKIDFDQEFKKHQELSRSGSEQKFKGGLGGTGEMETKYHTTTHLLRQALSDVLGQTSGSAGGQIDQKGSNITAERLRFDFAYGEKMTEEQKKKVEEIVNEKIAAAMPVKKVVMKKDEAEKTGAAHMFGDKYGDEVQIYYVGDTLDTAYSKEFCGGPHVENTRELAISPDLTHSQPLTFKILKEEAVSAGVRRIKAVLDINK